jgi:nucleoside-diphosphate-sugar epimerase
MSHNSIVLVTGANGYIAARTAEAFLKAGYSVRGTVRSKSSAKDLLDALSEYAGRLEIVEVPDITVPSAFDEAVKGESSPIILPYGLSLLTISGVDAIAHLAAPVSLTFTDPEPVLKGAIEGTLRALEAAHKEPSVKSFVFMSSIAAIVSTKEGAYTFTEADWDDEAEAAVAKLGKDAPGGLIYRASKTAAERTLWNFRDEKKPKFTMTSVNPT